VSKVQVGFSFDGFSPTSEALAFAREADRAGAAGLWMAEHLGYREALVSCMAFAMQTERAMVIPTAISPYLMHPTPTAMAFATMAEAAPGRVGIAVGVGNPLFLQEQGKTLEKPIRAVREYIEALRALWSGEAVHQEGMLFTLAGARMAFQPPEQIVVYIAAIGEQMLRLAGRMADGVVLSSGLSVAYAKQSLALCGEAAHAAGRDPSGLRKASYFYFAASADGRQAVDSLREKLAFLFRNRALEANIKSTGIPIDQEAIIAAVSRRDLNAASQLVPDEAVEAFAIAGTPRDCRDRLGAYIDAGVTEPVLMGTGPPESQAHALDIVRELSSER
jgi:5,10-methylenetetrahydromethanopterin reductase